MMYIQLVRMGTDMFYADLRSLTSHSFFCNCHFEPMENILVFSWIYLDTTFYQIERYYSCVSETTTEETTKTTESIILGITELTAVLFS